MKKQGRGRGRGREHCITQAGCVLSEYFVLCADGGMIGLLCLAKRASNKYEYYLRYKSFYSPMCKSYK